MVLTDVDAPEKAATADNVRKVVNGVRRRWLGMISSSSYSRPRDLRRSGREVQSRGSRSRVRGWGGAPAPVAGPRLRRQHHGGQLSVRRAAGRPETGCHQRDRSVRQRATVFPVFIKAFDDESADLDKNQRISVWEAFASASAGVRRHYQQRGQLSTERALIDDNGDGTGHESRRTGADGAAASRTYLDAADASAPPTDEELLKLLQRKSLLEAEVEELRIRRSFLPAEHARRNSSA